MTALLALPFAAQALAIASDEFFFHRKRRLPRWERISHPIDTLGLIGCLCLPLLFPPTRAHIMAYVFLGAISCLLTTKDEPVHARNCEWMEHWLHSVLFLLHPVVLFSTAYAWFNPEIFPEFSIFLWIQLSLMSVFLLYQIVYWAIYAAASNQ